MGSIFKGQEVQEEKDLNDATDSSNFLGKKLNICNGISENCLCNEHLGTEI
jgi:hypothetical protein